MWHMDRRNFLNNSVAATASFPLSSTAEPVLSPAVQVEGEPKIAVLLVDTDRVAAPINERIYGQFLEHINHSLRTALRRTDSRRRIRGRRLQDT